MASRAEQQLNRFDCRRRQVILSVTEILMTTVRSAFRSTILICALFLCSSQTSFAGDSDVEKLKKAILVLAESYQGRGDPDLSTQRSLEKLVQELLIANPQRSLSERLPLIYGPWKQVWGPYIYTDDSRGVDPSLDARNIYQVVFEGGYYYNVSPKLNASGGITSTGLLRGEYEMDETRKRVLNIQFTNLRRIDGIPRNGLSYIQLPALSEARKLEGESTVLPGFLVRWFFGGGSLTEVYSDSDLRIAFGSDRDNLIKNYLYVLKRISPEESRP